MSLRYRASLIAPGLERPVQTFGNDLGKIQTWAVEILAQRTVSDTAASVLISQQIETTVQLLTNEIALAERREALAKLKEKESRT